jgi:hypothetical protein
MALRLVDSTWVTCEATIQHPESLGCQKHLNNKHYYYYYYYYYYFSNNNFIIFLENGSGDIDEYNTVEIKVLKLKN